MKKLLLLLLFFPILLISQDIPVIYAQGGVSWAEWKENLTDEAWWWGTKDKISEGNSVKGTYISEYFNTSASSTLSDQGSSSYGVSNLNDLDPNTCWVEGASDYGIGEYFVIFPKDDFDAGLAGDTMFDIPNVIYNGYQKSYYLWINNSRVKKFKIYVDNEPVCYLALKDKMGKQSFDLPIKATVQDESWLVEWKEIKFEIVEVYKGNKWSDVAITELHRRMHYTTYFKK